VDVLNSATYPILLNWIQYLQETK